MSFGFISKVTGIFLSVSPTVAGINIIFHNIKSRLNHSNNALFSRLDFYLLLELMDKLGFILLMQQGQIFHNGYVLVIVFCTSNI